MAEGQYLNEERYQKNKKRLMIAALVVALAGLLIGGGLIAGGIIKKNAVSSIDTSMPIFSSNTSFDDAAQKGSAWFNNVANRGNEEFAGTEMIGIGVFILFASLMAAGGIVMFAKRREILAFQVQQVAPVAKEGVEKATPVVSKAAGSIAKEVSRGIKEGMKSESDEPGESGTEDKATE